MSGFFQHLKPVEPVVTDDGLGLLRGLEDLDRHVTSQTAPRILRGDNGRVVVAPFTLPFRAADAAPYERDYPSSKLPESNVTAKLGAVVNALEGVFDAPLTAHTLTNRSRSLLRGYSTIRQPGREFEVLHLGGSRWRVASGSISGGGLDTNTQVVAGLDLSASDAFLGFWLNLSPVQDPEDVENWVYAMSAGGLLAVSSYQNQGPTRTDDGTRYIWRPGSMFIPVAWVESPTRQRPARIVPMINGPLTFPRNYFGPGLPAYAS